MKRLGMLTAAQLKAGEVERINLLCLAYQPTQPQPYVVWGHNGREHIQEVFTTLKDARQAIAAHEKIRRDARADRILFAMQRGLPVEVRA